MTHDELYEELRGLMDSLDEHVEAEDAVVALTDLVGRIESTGLAPADDDEYDESMDACPACDTLPSKCYGGCCEDCNHANSWHAGMTTGSIAQESGDA